MSLRTNVIVTAISSRYDLSMLNSAIKSANSHMLGTINQNLSSNGQADSFSIQ